MEIDNELDEDLNCPYQSYEYYMSKEHQYRSKSYDFSKQKYISIKSRRILVRWLAQVNGGAKYTQETLHLAVSILDRVIGEHPTIGRDSFQLVGTTCMMIASKYLEQASIDPVEASKLMDDAHTFQEVCKVEAFILNKLEFNVSTVTIPTFLEIHLLGIATNTMEYNLAWLIATLTLLDPKFGSYSPSAVANAIMDLTYEIVVKHGVNIKGWSKPVFVCDATLKNQIVMTMNEAFAFGLDCEIIDAYGLPSKQYISRRMLIIYENGKQCQAAPLMT